MTHTPSPALNHVTYHRVYTDARGESHFDLVTVDQHLATAAPPAPPFYVSAERPASRYLFYSFEPGWFGDLHPAPARQFLALLSGKAEVETTDGEIRRLEPGDLVLLEDTAGRGHRTRSIGDVHLTFLVVPADPD